MDVRYHFLVVDFYFIIISITIYNLIWDESYVRIFIFFYIYFLL